MKKIILLIVISFLTLLLVGCEEKKTYETPELMPFEVLDGACKNLVIFIGDGMGYNHVKAGELVYDKDYAFTNWDQTSSDTLSYNQYIEECVETTDSAAGGTAIATGVVTLNSRVGKDHNGNDLATILDYAHAMGKKTGVVSTDVITGATPADFSGHSINRGNTEEILDTQMHSSIDLFIGQYSSYVSERQKDIEDCGYTLYSSYDLIEGINNKDKVWCQFAFEESGGDVTLKQSIEVATNYLSQDEDGYVLIIEQAFIDKYSHSNEFEPMVKAVNSLNDAVDYVLSIAKDDTGIIISADHETGELLVSDTEVYAYQYGNINYQYIMTGHGCVDVPVYIYGFEVDFAEFSKFGTAEQIKNSDIFRISLFAITGVNYTNR